MKTRGVTGAVQRLVCVFIVAIMTMTACSGVQTVAPYEIGKVAAEAILYDARILQNQGVITAVQFDRIRKLYDQLAIAQNIAIDARKTVIVFNTAENQEKVKIAMTHVIEISAQLMELAVSLGIKGVNR